MKKPILHKKAAAALLCLLGLGLALGFAPGGLGAGNAPVMSAEHPAYDGQLVIPVNKSQFVSVGQSYAEVAIGNPDIADVVTLKGKNIYVLGKKTGSTRLTISDDKGRPISFMDVVVTHDIDALRQKMRELAPDDHVEAQPAGDAVILSGQVASADRLRHLAAVAEQYAPGKVTNMLTVGGSQQVLLKVRFAEVQRSVLKDIGFTNALDLTNGSKIISTGEGLSSTTFGSAAATIAAGNFTLLSMIDALEKKGFVHTLAEPNLIALSGDNAKFLAGGEFPIPVAQNGAVAGSSVSVEFKQFGVGLSFTPTVVARDAINLQLEAEVSAIDSTVTVTTGGITVPGLKVRRSSTTIELLDGQSFAIAGLIEDNFEDTLKAIPGVASLPVIGLLFHSKNFERHQTELVVIIEAHLVKPARARALAAPTDKGLPPSEEGFLILGQTEREATPGHQEMKINGQYGYVLP